MTAGSIWDWLVLLIILGCPALIVVTETSGERASRRRFAIASFFWLPTICLPDVFWLFFNLRTDVVSSVSANSRQQDKHFRDQAPE
jgi:hypothetical protein